MSVEPQIVIVGGGTSGGAAAVAAADFGARVTLLDDRPQFDSGGKRFFEVHPARVWGVFPAWEAAGAIGMEPARFNAPLMILATGAFETTVPFPGSTLPGVMTASGFRRLTDLGLVPGGRVALVGDGENDDWLVDLAAEVGCELIALATPNEIEVHGDGQVESVTVASRTIPVDVVVVSGRRLPDVGLAAMAGCQLELEIDDISWRVVTDAVGRTSVEGAWACGDVRGIGLDRAAAEYEGRLCAAQACAALGLVDQKTVDSMLLEAPDVTLLRQPTFADAVYRQPWIQPLSTSTEGNGS